MKLILLFILLYNTTKETISLNNEGWSWKASIHISLVDNHVIKRDAEYTAYMED